MKLHRIAFALLLAPSVGCSSCRNDAGVPAASDAAPTTTAAAPSASAAGLDAAPARAPFCTVKVPPFVVDRGVRVDAGATLTTWTRSVAASTSTDAGGDAETSDPGDGGALPETGPRAVVGYAKGYGKPFVAEIDEGGRARISPVTSSLAALEEKPEGTTRRTVYRVVPLAPTAAGAEAAVDYLETTNDKTRRLHCGRASGGPFVSTSGASLLLGAADATSETVECRSVQAPEGPVALESTLTIDGTKMVAELLLGKTKIASKDTPMKAGDKASERYAFTLLGFASHADLSVATARFNGNVSVVPVAASDGAAPGAGLFWLGAATNAPSPTFDGSTLVVATTLAGKPELYLSTTPESKKAPGRLEALAKPEPRPMTDAPEGVAERGAPFVDGTTRVLVATEIAGGKKTARLHPIDAPATGGPVPYEVVPTQGSLVEARASAMPGGSVLVTTIAQDPKYGGVLEASVLSCGR